MAFKYLYNLRMIHMEKIPVVTLPPADLLKQAAHEPYSPVTVAALKSLNSVKLPPATGGSDAHIKQIIEALTTLVDAEQTADVRKIADPETPHAALSDNYFGVNRDGSKPPVETLSRATLRALYDVLIDIRDVGSTLTPVEIGNILKLPLINSMFVENEERTFREKFTDNDDVTEVRGVAHVD